MSVDQVEATAQCIDSNSSNDDMPAAYYDELQNDDNIETALFGRGKIFIIEILTYLRI